MPLSRANDQEAYVQAVPGYPGCIDFVKLLNTSTGFSPQEVWKMLYIQKAVLTLDLSEDSSLSHQLYHLYFEQQNQKKLRQNTPIYLGLPLLIWNDKKKLKAAPLFLLNVVLHPKLSYPGQWSLQIVPQSTIITNPLLHFSEINNKFWENADFNLPNFQERTQLATTYNARADKQEEWNEFINLENWSSNPGHKILRSNIILGIFDLPENYQEYQLNWPSLAEPIAKWRHQFTIPALDPNQRAVIDQSQDVAVSIVSGGPGTGKKHLTKALLINALSNRKRILFIAGKSTNIPKFQNYLDQQQLGHLSFWLRQTNQDLNLLLAMLTHPAKVDSLFQNEQKLKDWQKQTDELQQFKQRYDAAFRTVKRPIFGSFDWSQVVGLYLKAQKNAGKAILSSELSQKDFQFTIEEYDKLVHSVHLAQGLFENIKSIRHPLRVLHPNIFLTLSETEALHFTTKQLQFFLEQLTTLQQEYIQLTNLYRQKLNDLFGNYYRQQVRQIEDLELAISNNVTAYGRDFELSSPSSLKFIGTFSRRVKRIALERNKVITAYQHILQSIKPMPDLNFNAPAIGQQISIRQISQFLVTYKTHLKDWNQEIPTLIEQHLRRLNYQNAIPQVGLQTQLLDLEAKLDQIVAELNQSKLLAKSQTQPMLTLPKRQQKTEQLMDFLEQLQLNLSQFSPFYQWQHFWLQQEKNSQALIKAIIRAKPNNWVIAFENWYLQQLLTKNYTTSLPQEHFIDFDFFKKIEVIQQDLPRQINTIWEQSRQDLSKYFRKKQKQIAEKGSLPQFFASEGKSITAAIPIFFSTPTNAVKCFSKLDYPIFDLIIYESAQFIEDQLGRHLQKLGKQQLVIGNDQFIQDDEKADYLEYYLKQDLEVFQLQNIHKYYPANLFQLLNGSLITEKAIADFKVKAVALTGDYHEGLGINSAEVHYIIQFLQKLERSSRRTYPKIAIVCNTFKQRNYISKAILKIKQDGSFEEKENFLQMERNGLMVLHLEELQADRFELLLYSFTFGASKKQDGSFTAHAGILNTPAGQRQLNELMSTASDAIEIIHSISDKKIQAWASSENEPGYFLFANYLKMIQAIDEGDASAQKTITKGFQKTYPQASVSLLQQPIYDEIAMELQKQLPNSKIQRNFQQANLQVALLVQGSDNTHQKLAIVVDYFLMEAKASEFEWEIKQRKNLRQIGIQTLTTYSSDWWKHPQKAAQQLVEKIKLIWADQK